MQTRHLGPSRWELGWSEEWESTLGAGEQSIGRVAVEQRGVLDLITEAGVLRARLRGRQTFEAGGRLAAPAVGDWVVFDQPPGSAEAFVVRLLPRKTCLVRNAAGRRTEVQIIAANVDVVMIVTGAGRDFNPRRIQRYVSAASQSGAEPVIVISKADLASDIDAMIATARRAAPSAEVIATSAVLGTGIAELSRRLPIGRTAVVVGSSGAGKSSLINALLGADRQAVQAVRAGDERGQHTTTHRELIRLPGGGVILDTPGMRELALWADGADGPAGFDDLGALSARCRFRDCRHRGEPGCAVIEAVEGGDLEPERLEAWHKLERESARNRERQGGLAEHEARRQRKRFTKLVRRITRGGSTG